MTETEKMLFETFGTLRLNTEQLAKATGYKNSRSVLEAVRRGTFPLETCKDGKLRVADIRDVAAYLDKGRETAKQKVA
ncbi:MAG TPA: hypothetical protein VFL45_07225 [Gammaproteobacteria bacterium]|nr:hypothetical protein [Gammaproteobacteria bacterium]